MIVAGIGRNKLEGDANNYPIKKWTLLHVLFYHKSTLQVCRLSVTNLFV